ncbi:MAG: bifunctional glutamate N-acetyltransferase/amino-acid acetyltransferase ArgJ [Coriobacteriales bacterium]|jgi:glutamate N-acetyltransferase/amino-acid N-acetyltransferase|nr:bifunctional glutamate N-acetyltransferase/amino-acid acetyltransferase ArgJ [Coriobacteriales bacterium]
MIKAHTGTIISGVTFIEGGLGAVKGVCCAGVSAGFRRNPERKDLALVVTGTPATAAGVFTQNAFCAAPVTVSRAHLQECAAGADDGVRAIVLNSGNANAATGGPGHNTALEVAQIAAQALGCEPHQVLLASTGVIGVPLAVDGFVAGISQALEQLGSANGDDPAAGLAAAEAIMTTDTVPKQSAVTFTATQSDGVQVTYTIGGMCKGSGMIQPDMATMLAVLATDAALTTEAANLALREAVASSFNKVTVDSDTSTNDSAFFLATGATPGKTINAACPVYSLFTAALRVLCEDLARQIAADGEGATKLVTVNVTGAVTAADANLAARAVANSPLVKTAIAGHDANWGRIAMAIGKSGARFAQEDVGIAIMGIEVCEKGLTVPFDEDEALRRFAEHPEIVIDIDLGAGTSATRIWTCDLTHDYISINGDYRS